MEAVTQYLTDESIDGIFSFLSKAPTGGYLAFTYVHKDFLEGKDLMLWDEAFKKYVKSGLWKFGLTERSAPVFLEQHGWELLEDAASEDVVSKDILTQRALKTTRVERFSFARKR